MNQQKNKTPADEIPVWLEQKDEAVAPAVTEEPEKEKKKKKNRRKKNRKKKCVCPCHTINLDPTTGKSQNAEEV